MQSELKLPSHFDEAVKYTSVDTVSQLIRVSSSIQQHIDWIMQDFELGFEHVYIQDVSSDQIFSIEDFGNNVLPVIHQS